MESVLVTWIMRVASDGVAPMAEDPGQRVTVTVTNTGVGAANVDVVGLNGGVRASLTVPAGASRSWSDYLDNGVRLVVGAGATVTSQVIYWTPRPCSCS